MKTRILCLFALGTILTSNVAAQNSQESYTYVELQGGAQFTATDADITKLLTPSLGLSVGHYFRPYLGARLHLNGLQSKGRFETIGQDYKWNYLNTNADLLVNISQIFRPGDNPVDFIFLAGAGLRYAWHNDDLKALNASHAVDVPLMWDDNRLFHNIRAGLRLETNTSKPLGLSLELTANNTGDRFNSKTNNADDWQFVAMLGVNYRFNRHKKVVEPQPEPAPVVVEAPAPVVEKKLVKKTITEQVAETLNKEVFFTIRDSEPDEQGMTTLKSVADFILSHKDASLKISGYADKETGNPKLNQGYSQNRVVRVREILIGLGVDATLIRDEAFGDTVQPFAENDKNRCVIIEGQGIKTVEKVIEVEE